MIRICQFSPLMRNCEGCGKGYNSVYSVLVDSLTGQTRVDLCMDCLKELKGEIENIINKDEEER